MFPIVRNVPCTLKTLPNIFSHYDFPLIYCYFSFSITTPSLFGNVHWILKTAPQTSTPTVSTIPLGFDDFSLFYRFFFSFSIAMLSIFGNVPCTLKLLPNIISHYDFSLIYCYFSFSIATPSIFRNAHLILKTAPQPSSPTVSTIPLCF